MTIRNKIKTHAAAIALTMFFVVLLIWGCTANPVASAADHAPYEQLDQGWSQKIDGTLVPLADVQEFHPVQTGEPLVFSYVLPEITPGDVLLFHSEQQEVQCYVEGVLVQQFVMDDSFAFLETPGNAWDQVDLTQSMSGKTLTIILSSSLEEYANHLEEIYFVNHLDVDHLRLELLWFRGAIAVGLFVLVVVAAISGCVWRKQRRRKFFFSLARIYACILLWTLADLNFYDLFFGRPILCYLIGEFFVRLVAVALVDLARNSIRTSYCPRALEILRYLAWVNFILPWVLQLAFGVSLMETRIFNKATLLIVSVAILIGASLRVFHIKSLDRKEYPSIVLGLLVFGTIADVIIRWVTMEHSAFSGVWAVIGCGGYTIAVFTLFSVMDAQDAQEKKELAQSYQQLQNTALVQQIKAHFIFNVLNTISAYCKEDAHKADHAIQTFAAYLRAYLNFINQQTNISVIDELAMVKQYLLMEQMRFEERLTFDIHMEYLDFEVPPLSVQTLVENAVLHGIRGQEKGGKVTVTTQRDGDVAQIIVSDTGVGFDTSAPRKTTSVGLSNIKKRVRIMSEGSLTIESEVGIGTTATITIPLNEM